MDSGWEVLIVCGSAVEYFSAMAEFHESDDVDDVRTPAMSLLLLLLFGEWFVEWFVEGFASDILSLTNGVDLNLWSPSEAVVPQVNTVERYNRTLVTDIAALVGTDWCGWDSNIRSMWR